MRKIFVVFSCLLLMISLFVVPVRADDATNDEFTEYVNPYPLYLSVKVYDGVSYWYDFYAPHTYAIRSNTGYASTYFYSGTYNAFCKHLLSNISEGATSFPVLEELTENGAYASRLDFHASAAFVYDVDWNISAVFYAPSSCYVYYEYEYLDAVTFEWVKITDSVLLSSAQAQSGYSIFAELRNDVAIAYNGVCLVTRLYSSMYDGVFEMDGSSYGLRFYNLGDVTESDIEYANSLFTDAVEVYGQKRYNAGFNANSGVGGVINDLTVWLGQTVDGVMDVKLFGTFGLGDIFGALIGIGIIAMVLKWFLGG